MGHGKRSEMKKSCLSDERRIHIIFIKHHVRPGIAVKRKLPVSVRKRMHKCQGRIDRIIHQQIGRVDPYFLQCVVQKHSKLILSDLSEKCRSLSKFVQHCQHIAWRASRARLKQIVSLFAFSIHCKINEKFSHCDHIIFLFHPHTPPSIFTYPHSYGQSLN